MSWTITYLVPHCRKRYGPNRGRIGFLRTEAGIHGAHPRFDLAGDGPTLENWTRSQALSHHQVQRARMLLGLAAGQSLVAVAVVRWRNRNLAEGLEGLADWHPLRSGAGLHGLGPDSYVEAAAGGPARRPHRLELEPDGPGNRHLDRPTMPLVVSGRDPAPPRVRTCQLSDAPQFEAKLRGVIAVCDKGSPDCVGLCFDKKPRMQALARTRTGLPATPTKWCARFPAAPPPLPPSASSPGPQTPVPRRRSSG